MSDLSRHGDCCPLWASAMNGKLSTSDKGKHDSGCIWSEQSTPLERIAVKAIDAAMEWWEKRQAASIGKEEA